MARLNHRGGSTWATLWLATALLAGSLLETTCQVTVPETTLNMDDEAIHMEVPGLTIHIEPGRFQMVGSSIQVDAH